MNLKKNIYNKSIEDLYKEFDTNIGGLSEKEAKLRLEKYGKNKLEERKKESAVFRYFNQFTNVTMIFLNFVVIFSVVVAYVRDESYIDSIIVAMICIINSILGYFQGKSADKAIEKLNQMFDCDVVVFRDGKKLTIDATDVVVGDIIELDVGDYVLCDGRIISQKNFEVNESALTDNSMVVSKQKGVLEGNKKIDEQSNMVFSGSNVINGSAIILVCGTGMNTELGKIANKLLNKKDKLSPLQKRIENISLVLVYIVLFLIFVMIVIGIVNKNDLFDVLVLSILLTIAAIPEGLSSVITIVLSISMMNMVKKNFLIKRMATVDTLGEINVICIGKTTNLTQNKIMVKSIFVDDKVYYDNYDRINSDIFDRCIYFCNDAKKDKNKYFGNDIDIALYKYLENINFDFSIDYDKVNEIPFDYEKKKMEVTVKVNGSNYVFVKGSPDIILRNVNKYISHGKINDYDDDYKEKVLNMEKYMSWESLEVIALAYRDDRYKDDLIFIGLVGFFDEFDNVSIKAIENCRKTGIDSILFTGNSISTAKAIALEAGLITSEDEVIDGRNIDNMTDDELYHAVEKYKVYSRITPNAKLRIIEMLKHKGMVVAMTGDGVNDAPAIQESDVGIGLGVNGSEVVKEVADCILTDNSFLGIVSGIEEGRRISLNIKKVLMYIITTNIIEVLLLFVAMLLNVEMFTAIQIYWINLVTGTVPAIMLAFEKSENEILNNNHKNSNLSFFTPLFIIQMVFSIIVKTIVSLILYFYFIDKTDLNIANSLLFIFLIIHEFLFSFSCRNLDKNVINKNIFANKHLSFSILLLVVFQILILCSDLGMYFIVPNIEVKYIFIVIMVSLVLFFVDELSKPLYSWVLKIRR